MDSLIGMINSEPPVKEIKKDSEFLSILNMFNRTIKERESSA